MWRHGRTRPSARVARCLHVEATLDHVRPHSGSAASPARRSLHSGLHAGTGARVALHHRVDGNRARSALAGFHEADTDRGLEIGTPGALLGLSPCAASEREELFEQVGMTPPASPAPERSGEILERIVTESTAEGVGVLVRIRVEAWLLGRRTVLVVLSSLLLVLQNLQH